MDYVKDFSSNNIARFSLGVNSNIIMENLEIKKEILQKWSIPM